MAVFVYSSYWRTWSRLLLENMDRSGTCVEVNLTHINGDWSLIPKQVIRKHITKRGINDRLTQALPLQVQRDMKLILGEELSQRLLTYDYLPEIDWRKYDRVCNGGADFDSIRREFKE